MKLRNWYIVHCLDDARPSPDEMLESLRPHVLGLRCELGKVGLLGYRFKDNPTDKGEWFTFRMASSTTPLLHVRQILPDDPAFLRNDNGWKNRLMTSDDLERENVVRHLQKVRQSIHLMPIPLTMGKARLARICEQLCGHLARTHAGLIQVYQAGYFNSLGESVLPFEAKHRLKAF